MRDARLGNRITILTDPTARGIGGPAERAMAGCAQAAQFAEQERVDIAPWHDVIRNGCRRHSAVFQANPAQWFTMELGATKAQPRLLFVERMRLRHQKSCYEASLYHLQNGLNRVFGRYGAATLGLIVFIFHGV